MREASSRLGPRSDHVEEQATDGHADRERVGQVDSPPSRIPEPVTACRMRHRRGAVTGRVARILGAAIVHARIAWVLPEGKPHTPAAATVGLRDHQVLARESRIAGDGEAGAGVSITYAYLEQAPRPSSLHDVRRVSIAAGDLSEKDSRIVLDAVRGVIRPRQHQVDPTTSGQASAQAARRPTRRCCAARARSAALARTLPRPRRTRR